MAQVHLCPEDETISALGAVATALVSAQVSYHQADRVSAGVGASSVSKWDGRQPWVAVLALQPIGGLALDWSLFSPSCGALGGVSSTARNQGRTGLGPASYPASSADMLDTSSMHAIVIPIPKLSTGGIAFIRTSR